MDRRAVFFFVVAVVTALLYPAAPPDLRWVPIGVSVTYLTLTVLVALDAGNSRDDD